jgi:hypothetical protein
MAMNETDLLDAGFAAIDAANSRDPGTTSVDGGAVPAALLYGQRMSACLTRFARDADIALRIAARGQHIERWTLPRASYEAGRIGYLKWRTDLKAQHAVRLAGILRPLGADEALIARVGALVRKERMKSDPDAQTLEDVACLVFLEFELGEFTTKHDDDKLANILAKTWRKMSERGHEAALALEPPERIVALLHQGLATLEQGQ